MRIVRFRPLEMTQSEVRVTWTVEPTSIIYDRTNFKLDFGASLDPRSLPLGLWWTVVLLILHSHWNLLRPCRIHLPFSLAANEIEFWLRLLDQERVTIEYLRGTQDFDRTIEIESEGPVLLNNDTQSSSVDRWATAFSGGKDSLLQTALLCEMTQRPLLVNTQAPMPPLIDNTWPFRDRTLSEISRRRDVELVVVKSDLRTCWSHYEVPHKLGYPFSMGLLADPFLVTANTLAVAASRGIRSLTLASEIEESHQHSYHGRISFDESNMGYALPLIRSIDRFLRCSGMNLSSLLTPFNHFQIETLVRKRYADLADLQISCFWMDKPDERSCSRCTKCLRIAIILMAIGEDPASLGIDLNKMFTPPYDYDPSKVLLGGLTIPHAASMIDRLSARRYFPRRGLLERLSLRDSQALREFNKVADVLVPLKGPAADATHLGYFQFIPEIFRERIKAISLEFWPEIDNRVYTPDETTISAMVDWITATL